MTECLPGWDVFVSPSQKVGKVSQESLGTKPAHSVLGQPRSLVPSTSSGGGVVVVVVVVVTSRNWSDLQYLHGGAGDSEESSLMNQTTVKYKLDQHRIEGDYAISSSPDHGDEY